MMTGAGVLDNEEDEGLRRCMRSATQVHGNTRNGGPPIGPPDSHSSDLSRGDIAFPPEQSIDKARTNRDCNEHPYYVPDSAKSRFAGLILGSRG